MKRRIPLQYLCIDPGLNIPMTPGRQKRKWFKALRNMFNSIFR